MFSKITSHGFSREDLFAPTPIFLLGPFKEMAFSIGLRRPLHDRDYKYL